MEVETENEQDRKVRMMDADQFYTSKGGKYLKGDDIEGQEWELTISGIERGGQDDFYPIYLRFHEIEQLFGLNKGNYALVKENVGTPETDKWMGKKIVLYGTRGQNKEGTMMNVVRVRPPEREVKRVVPGKSKSKSYDDRNPPPHSDKDLDDTIPF